MKTISWSDFEQVELRVGTILSVEAFPEARKPAYKITVDFGPEIGIKQSSAQITTLYPQDELIGRQILGVVNFPPKQIGPFRSEFLVTGFYDPTEPSCWRRSGVSLGARPQAYDQFRQLATEAEHADSQRHVLGVSHGDCATRRHWSRPRAETNQPRRGAGVPTARHRTSC